MITAYNIDTHKTTSTVLFPYHKVIKQIDTFDGVITEEIKSTRRMEANQIALWHGISNEENTRLIMRNKEHQPNYSGIHTSK